MSAQTPAPSLEVPTCDDRPLWDAWMSWFHFPTLMVADELGLFALLAHASRTEPEIRE